MLIQDLVSEIQRDLAAFTDPGSLLHSGAGGTITWVRDRREHNARLQASSRRFPDVVIDGKTIIPTGVSDFVANLEASGYFKRSVEIVSTTVEARTAPVGELIRFQIRGIFQQPGSTPAGAPAAPGPAATVKKSN